MTIDTSSILSAAAEYRASCDSVHESNSGVVLINSNGEVYGWKNELRNPESECPGSYAVDVSGRVHIAIGGNAYDGADQWLGMEGAK